MEVYSAALQGGLGAASRQRPACPAPTPERVAFDLLELNGTDMRREPIEVRKATLASILRKARHGVRIATVRANGVLSISMMTVAATSRSSPVLRPRGGRAITSRRSNLVALRFQRDPLPQ